MLCCAPSHPGRMHSLSAPRPDFPRWLDDTAATQPPHISHMPAHLLLRHSSCVTLKAAMGPCQRKGMRLWSSAGSLAFLHYKGVHGWQYG